jgi:hypothetical protein
MNMIMCIYTNYAWAWLLKGTSSDIGVEISQSILTPGSVHASCEHLKKSVKLPCL